MKKLITNKKFIITIVIITIILTLNLSIKSSILYSNFSYIGNTLGYRIDLIIWCFFTSSSFYLILNKLNYLKKHQLLFVYITILLSSIIPFYNDKYHFISFLHILFGYISFISLNMSIYYTLHQISLFDYIKGTKFKNIYITIMVILGIIACAFGSINSLFEVLFTIVMLIFGIIIIGGFNENN